MNDVSEKLPDIDSIRAAAERLKGEVFHTPLISNSCLDKLTGAKVFIKPECLQITGSFKLRGAINAITQLPASERKNGVVACSSGNHAQGVAEAARRLGIPATIVMPSDSPPIKITRTKRAGATVVEYNRATEDREAIAKTICDQQGSVFIHPYENINVIAGQGTCGLEIAKDLAALGEIPDRILVCCGGGGLAAGLAIGVHGTFPTSEIHTVEPEGFDDYARSLKQGERLSNKKKSGSICDAILTGMPGKVSFAVAQQQFSEGLVVDDAAVANAVRFAFEELKLVAEPGGAVALAALLESQQAYKDETIVVVISGGNAEPEIFGKILSREI